MNNSYRPRYEKLTWLDDWREFFNLSDILPDFSQDVPEQFNCITRILILLILFLYMFYGFSRYVMILLVVMFGIIILFLIFYKQTPIRPMREAYESIYPKADCVYQPSIIMYDSKSDAPVTIAGTNMNPSLIDTQQSGVWCQAEIPLENLTGLNQQLAGCANPKTKVIPVVPPPIYDGQTWTPNDLVVPFKINDQRRQELWQNGYMTWEKEIPVAQIQKDMFDTYSCTQPRRDGGNPLPSMSQVSPISPPSVASPQQIREDFAPPDYSSAMYNQSPNDVAVTNSMINTSCGGYYPENARYNYPVNSPPYPCMDAMSEYNKNLYSIPLQPDVYTRSQVNQPDASMSNLGISFTQPHLPYACRMDDRGNMMFDEFDPNQYPSEYISPTRQQTGVLPRNEIYDPRLTGYGTSYRSYNDPLTGQPRFYYDDIDAHTQSNFISRNKIDFTNFAPTTGTYPGLPPQEFRPLADQTFHNDIMKQRTELQYRLMAKNSHREWQRRSAPIQTMGYGRAGCGPTSVGSYAGPRGGC